MKAHCWIAVFVLAASSGALRAEEPIELFDPLPVPLKLPPGMVQTLPLNKTASFFGDMLRAVDCADDKDLPHGTCGNQLFGGLAMTDSHLTGNITIRFYPPVRNIAHFDVTHGLLTGDDSVLAAPKGFEMPTLFNQVRDAVGHLSEGDLDLTTGRVTNLKYNVQLLNSAIVALANVNPKIEPPVVTFPGVRGHTWARFEQRDDGLLDFTFRGTTFLPLGKDTEGDPIRFPMPMCGPALRCASVLARGTSLHPHLYLSTKAPGGPDCGANCPDIPFNTVQDFTVFTHNTAFGDDFHLDIPELGGDAGGRSHLQGRLIVQFGPRTGDTVPFAVSSVVPQGLFAEPPPGPLGPGFLPGLIGQEENLTFPKVAYRLQKTVFIDDPFNFAQGAIDLRTGRVIGEMVWPSYFVQNLAEHLLAQNDGRVGFDPFFLVARGDRPDTLYALFEKGANGQLIFRYSADHKRSFATYRWPSPDYVKANSWISGPEGALHLFLRIQAMRTVDVPRARLAGGAANIRSSVGDTFSYSYSIPCDPAGASFSFEYANQNPGNAGGTFRMKRLAAVSCTNSRMSTLPPGDYDTVTFSGFGSWSKDPDGSLPRFATVQVSTHPQAPYVGILVYQNPDAENNVVLSTANTRPAEKQLP